MAEPTKPPAKTPAKMPVKAGSAKAAVKAAPTKAVVAKAGTKPVAQTTAKAAAPAAAPNTKAVTTAQSVPLSFFKNLLRDDGLSDAPVKQEGEELARRKRLLRLITYQMYAIIALIALLLVGVPFFQPVYEHYVLSPEHEVRQLASLDAPNLTNQAVLSWATSRITEIMTVGFGDYDRQILAQRGYFTAQGWESFVEALNKQNDRETFLQKQLVLTTVPADTAVITEQGEDADQRYFWKVELPVVMTYTTNNNVTQKKRPIISLTLVRVPTSENFAGIAIKLMSLAGK